MLKPAPATRFEQLIVWQKSHQLTLLVYKITVTYPKHELYGLVAQMRRAAVSVPRTSRRVSNGERTPTRLAA